jgi:integrase
VWQGEDPQATKREARIKAKAAAKLTLRTVIDNFLAFKQSRLRPRSLYEALQDWKSLHGWPIDKISRAQVAAILGDLEKTAPVAAARTRSTLSGLFAWAMGRGYVDHNAVVGTNNPDTRVKRDRVLTDNELATVWNACEDNHFGNTIRLLILTGQRRQEVGA